MHKEQAPVRNTQSVIPSRPEYSLLPMPPRAQETVTPRRVLMCIQRGEEQDIFYSHVYNGENSESF